MIFVVLVGIPCSGKSTSAKRDFGGYTVIERDALLLDVAGVSSYAEAWGKLPSGGQDEVDGLFFDKLREALLRKDDIVIDRTNVSVERRAELLALAPPDAHKVAVFYPTSPEECQRRNLERRKQDDKCIPHHVIDDMYERLVVPCTSEGFDQVITYAENKN